MRPKGSISFELRSIYMENEITKDETIVTEDEQTVDTTVVETGKAEESKKELSFDDLDDDVKRLIDKERTKASKTARQNAFKDPQFRESIKAQLEKEAQMSAEEKLRAKEESIMRKTSELSAREYLMKNGNLFGDDLEDALDFVVTTDVDATLEKSQKYVSTLQKMINSATEKKVQDLIKNQPKPREKTETRVKAFKDMTYNERVQLKQTDPSRFQTEMNKLKSRI